MVLTLYECQGFCDALSFGTLCKGDRMSAVDVRTVEVYDLFARNKSNNEEDNFIINTGTVCNTWYGKSEHEARHVYSFYKPLFSNRNRVIA